MYSVERLTHHFHFLQDCGSEFCPGLGKHYTFVAWLLVEAAWEGFQGKQEKSCDIMTWEEMFWNRKNSVVTL